MQRFIEMLGAALTRIVAAMVTMVWVPIRIACRIVYRLVADPQHTPPAPISEARAVPSMDTTLQHIRSAAKDVLSGAVTDKTFASVADHHVAWLSTLDRIMLSKVSLADDAVLRAHITGKQAIRGVVAADRESVSDCRRAMKRNPMGAGEPDEYFGMKVSAAF